MTVVEAFTLGILGTPTKSQPSTLMVAALEWRMIVEAHCRAKVLELLAVIDADAFIKI